MNPRKPILPVIVASALGIVILGGLGIWQLQRLEQKRALLAEIDNRSNAAPVDLSEAISRHVRGERIEFLKVAAKGRFLHDAEKFMIATFNGGAAWEVVTPLLTTDNILVLVDRGLVPDEKRALATRAKNNPDGVVDVVGIIHSHHEGRGPFTPDNDIAANMWFWWDVPAMLENTAMPQDVSRAPFVLHVLPSAGQNFFPRPVALRTSIPNNHLQYAITWFLLALVLALVTGLFIREQMKKSGA